MKNNAQADTDIYVLEIYPNEAAICTFNRIIDTSKELAKGKVLVDYDIDDDEYFTFSLLRLHFQ